jgi:hypothetical protein
MNNFMIFCRMPQINESSIEWVEWIRPSAFQQFINSLGTNTSNIASLLEVLLAHNIPLVAAERNRQDQQVLMALESYLAWSIIGRSGSNFHSMLRMLNLYHSSAQIDMAVLIQISLLLISEPGKKHPLRFFQNFDRSNYSDESWNLSNAEYSAGKSPLQKFLKNTHRLALIGYIRAEYEEAKNYKRTILNVIKRTPVIQMGEALYKNGVTPVTPLIILHRTFCDVVSAKGFYTKAPQAADYQRLHRAYQQALIAKQEAPCSLTEMRARLDQLKCSIMNYSNNGRIYSLNEVVGENGHEFINMLSDDKDPYDNCINLEPKRKARELKNQIHQQIEALAPIYRQSFCLTALMLNDSKVARIMGNASSTTKRQRIQIMKRIVTVTTQNRKEVEAAYLQVVSEYFIINIINIYKQIIVESHDFTKEVLIDIVNTMNQRWGIALITDQELLIALFEMLQREGLVSTSYDHWIDVASP